jgi:hypothetical protein
MGYNPRAYSGKKCTPLSLQWTTYILSKFDGGLKFKKILIPKTVTLK